MNTLLKILFSLGFGLLFGNAVLAATPDEIIQPIQKRWAEIKYQIPEKQQAEQYQALAQESRKLVEANPGVAEILIWDGIVISSEAGARSGLGALSLAKDASQLLDFTVVTSDPNEPLVLTCVIDGQPVSRAFDLSSAGVAAVREPGNVVQVPDEPRSRPAAPTRRPTPASPPASRRARSPACRSPSRTSRPWPGCAPPSARPSTLITCPMPMPKSCAACARPGRS